MGGALARAEGNRVSHRHRVERWTGPAPQGLRASSKERDGVTIEADMAVADFTVDAMAAVSRTASFLDPFAGPLGSRAARAPNGGAGKLRR